MIIPKTIRMPRKLKKELKKGIERKIRVHGPYMGIKPASWSMYETVSYLGSGTKPCHRLYKYLRKEEKRIFRKSIKRTCECLQNYIRQQDTHMNVIREVKVVKNYYLCSQSVIGIMNPVEVSNQFKSGYDYDKEDNYFIAVLDFEKVEEQYNKLPEEQQYYFWCREIVPGTMDVSNITIEGIKRNGLFKEIELKTGLSTERNQAMVIHNLSKKYNCSPIAFIGRIV